MKNNLVQSSNFSYQLATKRHSLNENKIFTLKKYQKSLCNALSWVETDSEKWSQILIPFLESGYLHEQNDLTVCKYILKTYYQTRINLSLQISDDELIKAIYQHYIFISGMGIENLQSRVFETFHIEE